MPQENSSWSVLHGGVERRTGERHTFIIPRSYAHTLTLGGELFCGSMGMPHVRPAAPPKDRAAPYHTLCGVLAQALAFAEAHSDHKLLIAAHCLPLTSGAAPGTRGLAISKLRALAMQGLLSGDRATFVEGSQYHDVPDVQRMLAWVDQTYGYGCTVKKITNLRTEQATGLPAEEMLDYQGAIQAFRSAHQQRFDATFPEYPDIGEEELGALFDLINLSLAQYMETDADGLAAARSKVTFLAPERLGCGDIWPERQLDSSRVDLLFFEPDPPPPRFQDDTRPGACIYRNEMYVRRFPVEVPPEPVPVCVRMTGMYFDTNKSFLLPSALPGMQKLTEVYNAKPEGELLVVGHTDTSGEPEPNLALSLERAQAVVAYLTDDVQTWLACYEADIKKTKRWGAREDLAMLSALPDGEEHNAAISPVKSYQGSRGLGVDGKCGPNTRTQLITDYMALDGTTLPQGIAPIAHGCGEHFPHIASGDDINEAQNRRVELFHFEQGIKPAPAEETSGQSATEYGHWKQAVVLNHQFSNDQFEVVALTDDFHFISSQFPLLEIPKAFTIAMHKIFGDDISVAAIDSMRERLIKESFPAPRYRITNALEEGVLGAFAEGVIHLSSDLVEAAQHVPLERWKLFAVMIEEYGHFIDHQLRNHADGPGGDARGDEGTRFGAFYIAYRKLFTTDFQFGSIEKRNLRTGKTHSTPLSLSSQELAAEERAKFLVWAQEEGSESGYIEIDGRRLEAEYFKIEGQGAVHERITEEAAKAAGVPFDARLDRGVAWPDVPTFDENSPPVPSGSGMSEAQLLYNSPKTNYAGLSSNHIGHMLGLADENTPVNKSHYGINQFWHAMSPGSHLTNQQVLDKIIDQHEIWWAWALADNMGTRGIPLPLSLKKQGLFHVGKILHTVQDSFSHSHTIRGINGILSFQDYTKQDSDEHAEHDRDRASGALHDIPGVPEAVRHSTTLLKLFKTRTPFPSVRAYLLSHVFEMAPGAAGKASGDVNLKRKR